jgi:hypothetical protein
MIENSISVDKLGYATLISLLEMELGALRRRHLIKK